MRIPLPVFYLAEDDAGRMVVVDGLQRLSTFQRFMSGELDLRLPDRAELHGKTFDDLQAKLQTRIEGLQSDLLRDRPRRCRSEHASTFSSASMVVSR